MDHDREAEPLRDEKLPAEPFGLNRRGIEFVVIVEADLAQADEAAPAQQLLQPLDGFIEAIAALVRGERIDPRRADERSRAAPGQLQRSSGILDPGPDGDATGEPGLPRAPDHVVHVGREVADA